MLKFMAFFCEKSIKLMEKTPLTSVQMFCHFLFCVCVCVCVFSRAAPMAYGSSQSRGLIRAVAAGLCQSHHNAGSEPCLQPTAQLTATQDP